jgi:hypothetical protein
MKIICPVCSGTGKLNCMDDVDWIDENNNINCPICFSENIDVYDLESILYWLKMLVVRIKHELGILA